MQEALTNIARHAQATQVRIEIRRTETPRGIEVMISDNGRGADPNRPRTGLGLVGMRERVMALGGSIELASDRGQGFTVKAFLPLPSSP